MSEGKVAWIGLRPERGTAMQIVDRAEIDLEQGLVGDCHAGGAGHRRQVTLFQMEHLDVMQSLLKRDVRPEMTRRNIGVSGINLQSFAGKDFRVGNAVLRYTDPCHPCGRMNTTIGEGGLDAMAGHGGIMAYVIEGGPIAIGDEVAPQP